MSEQYEFSKAKHKRQVLEPEKRESRLKMAAALTIVAVLVAAYVTQRVPHWWLFGTKTQGKTETEYSAAYLLAVDKGYSKETR